MSTLKRIGSGAIICLPILLQSITAKAADERAPESAAESAPTSAPNSAPNSAPGSDDWSVAAGIGFNGPSYGFGYYSRTGPAWGLTLERRLNRRLWLLFGANGQYHVSARGSAMQGYDGAEFYGVEGNIGLRYVFNPGKPFELSSYGMAGAFHSYLGSPYEHVSATGAQATIGISLDRELTRGVGLRVSTNLVSGGWGHEIHDYYGQPSKYHNEGLYASIGLQPMVELRTTF